MRESYYGVKQDENHGQQVTAFGMSLDVIFAFIIFYEQYGGYD
jgi:hypothetical protein